MTPLPTSTAATAVSTAALMAAALDASAALAVTAVAPAVALMGRVRTTKKVGEAATKMLAPRPHSYLLLPLASYRSRASYSRGGR